MSLGIFEESIGKKAIVTHQYKLPFNLLSFVSFREVDSIELRIGFKSSARVFG